MSLGAAYRTSVSGLFLFDENSGRPESCTAQRSRPGNPKRSPLSSSRAQPRYSEYLYEEKAGSQTYLRPTSDLARSRQITPDPEASLSLSAPDPARSRPRLPQAPAGPGQPAA